jgi:chromosome segregation ATPase
LYFVYLHRNTDKIIKATFEKERLDAKVVELQAEVAQMTKDNESLRLNLNANAAVVSQKEAELIEVHAKHQECIKAIDELHQSSQFALAVQKMEQLVEKSDLERQLADKSVELENLRKKLRGSKRSKDIQAIKQDFAALKQSTEEFNRIKTQLTEADVVVQEQASELAVLREQLEDMRVGARLNTAMLRMNKFLEQAQARDWIKTREQITSMKQEIVSISWELRASKREADELRVELETTKAAFEQKVKELAKARSDSFSLQFKIERQQLEINELQKIAAAEHAMNTKLLSFAKKVNAPSKPCVRLNANFVKMRMK